MGISNYTNITSKLLTLRISKASKQFVACLTMLFLSSFSMRCWIRVENWLLEIIRKFNLAMVFFYGTGAPSKSAAAAASFGPKSNLRLFDMRLEAIFFF